MKTTDQNRVNMVTTTSNVIDKDIWKEHEAFSEGAEGVEALAERLGQIHDQLQIAPGNPGAKDLKESVRKSLCASACEVIGAVRAYAAKNDDPELTARVGCAPSEITAGKASDVVARCRTISTAAAEIMTKLIKYGITAAKLVTFKKRIDAFDGVKVVPRQNRVKKSAAVQLLPQLVRDAGGILRNQLDGLMIQFHDASPNFYEEDFAARAMVDNRGGRSSEVEPQAVPANPEPVAKAA